MMMQESREENWRKAGIMYVMCGVKKKVSKKIRCVEDVKDEEEEGEEDDENGWKIELWHKDELSGVQTVRSFTFFMPQTETLESPMCDPWPSFGRGGSEGGMPWSSRTLVVSVVYDGM